MVGHIMQIFNPNFLRISKLNISEYQNLEINDRADLLWEMGVLIDIWADNERTLKLFHLYYFFVEVAVSNDGEGITEISAFQEHLRLEKYLNKISIESLS